MKTRDEMGKERKFVKFVEFSPQNIFQICACDISARTAKHLDVTPVFTACFSANQSTHSILVI